MPPFPSGPTQFRHLARILEIVVFPTPRVPVKDRRGATDFPSEHASELEQRDPVRAKKKNHEAATCVPKLGMTLGYSEICCSADYAESCSPVIELLSMRIILSQFCSDCPIRHRVRKYFFTSKKSAKHSPIHPDL